MPITELRRTVAAWIEAYGFSVHEAASAEDALEEMEVSQHAVALCDASAAGRDGVWLAWRLRERCPNTAIIVATAIRDCETAVSRLRNDVVDYLLKPFDRERLYEALSLGRDWHAAAAGADRAASGVAGSAAQPSGAARGGAGRSADHPLGCARRADVDAAAPRARRPRARHPRGASDAVARRRARCVHRCRAGGA